MAPKRPQKRNNATRRVAEAARAAALLAEQERAALLAAHKEAEELAFEESNRRAQEEAVIETAKLRRIEAEHAARADRLSVGPKARPPTPPPQHVEECSALDSSE